MGVLAALLSLAGALAVALVLPALNEPALFSWHAMAFGAALKILGIVVGAALVWVSWRMVGGRTNYGRFIAAYAYLSAAWLIIFSLLTAIDEGALRLMKPKLFAEIAAVASSGQDANRLRALLGSEATYAMKVLLYSDEEFAYTVRTPGIPWIVSMSALRGVFTFAWLIVSWGALRKILSASRLQSVLSLAIFLCFGLIILMVIVFFQMAPLAVDPNRWIRKIQSIV